MYSLPEEGYKMMQVMLECSVFHVLSPEGQVHWYYVPKEDNTVYI